MAYLQTLYQHFSQSFGVATDSRSDVKDSLFFALSGENFDAHNFVPSVLENGATRAVVSRPVDGYEDRCIIVPDVLEALQSLAQFYRQQLSAKVLGITGSNGKTTTKELVVRVLRTQYRVHATPGNFNNLIGLPLTILSCPKDCEILVLEMGSNAFGEIARLCAIGLPELGLITNIGDAHLQGFENRTGVRKEKTALYRSVVQNGGRLFVNESDDILREEAEISEQLTFYGIQTANQLSQSTTYLEVDQFVPHIHGSLIVNGAATDMQIELPGAHNAINCAAAAAIGSFLGILPNNILRGLKSYQPGNNRTQVIRTPKMTIILDAYNANPISVHRALDMLDEWPNDKKVAILGDMKELGSHAGQAHQAVVDRLRNTPYHLTFVVGEEMKRVDDRAFPTTSALGDYLKDNLEELTGGVVLIKGSRSMGLEQLLSVLRIDVE